MHNNNIPQHVAIIMDGNGRWAKESNLPRTAGHREGVKRAKEIIAAAIKAKVKVLTLFAFSTENWSRPKKEISVLMSYLRNFLDRQGRELLKNNVRLRVIGRDEPLPDSIRLKIRQLEDKSSSNNGLNLVLALNYGGRQEIIDAAKAAYSLILSGDISVDEFNEDKLAGFLYTAGLPDPDLLIRTSGELRLSNFLIWQLAYTELYFVKKYWPDFKESDFLLALKEYKKRQRRFGNIS